MRVVLQSPAEPRGYSGWARKQDVQRAGCAAVAQGVVVAVVRCHILRSEGTCSKFDRHSSSQTMQPYPSKPMPSLQPCSCL